MCNHWRINWMSSIQDYSINQAWKTEIFFVSLNLGWTRTWKIYTLPVKRFSSPELNDLMISCRPWYLPREHSSIFFSRAVYLPPQTDAGPKTALNQLYRAISKQEHAHPEAGDYKAVFPSFLPACHLCIFRWQNSWSPLLFTQRHIQGSSSLSIWQICP